MVEYRPELDTLAEFTEDQVKENQSLIVLLLLDSAHKCKEKWKNECKKYSM